MGNNGGLIIYGKVLYYLVGRTVERLNETLSKLAANLSPLIIARRDSASR